MQWHELHVSVSTDWSVRTVAWSRRAAHSVAMARRSRRGGRDRRWTIGRNAAGRDAISPAEDSAKVVRAREAALFCNVFHGVVAGLGKAHGEDQAQAVEVLAWGDSPGLTEEAGKVETAQLRHLRHFCDPDRSSVVLSTEILDLIDEGRLERYGSFGFSSVGQIFFRQFYEDDSAQPCAMVGRRCLVFQRHPITSLLAFLLVKRTHQAVERGGEFRLADSRSCGGDPRLASCLLAARRVDDPYSGCLHVDDEASRLCQRAPVASGLQP